MAPRSEHDSALRILAAETEVVALLDSGAPLAVVLEKIVRGIEDLSPGTIASILLLDPNGHQVRHGAAPSLPDEYNRAIDGEPIGPDAGSCGTAAYRCEPVIVTDIETDPLWGRYRELARRHNLRACWSTPIFDEKKKVLGTFAMYHREKKAPQKQDFKLIDHASLMARIAIERTRANEALKTRQRELSVIFSNFQDVVFYLVCEPNENYRFLAVNPAFLKATGLGENQVIGKLVTQVLPESALAVVLVNYKKAIDEKRTVQWDEVSVYPSGEKHGEVSVTPVFDTEGVCTHIVGLVHDITERTRGEATVHKLNKELERLAALIVGSQEEQIEHVSREVHDNLGQSLVALKMDLHAKIAGLRDGPEKAGLVDTEQYLDFILQECRAISHRISPLALSRIGISRALADMVAAFTRSSFLSVDVNMDDLDESLTPPQALHLYRIIQEAFANSTKHSGASVIKIHGATHSDRILVTIEDNGRGFDLNANSAGIGLLLMKQRASLLGGNLHIESTPGVGTIISAEIPVDQPVVADRRKQ